MSELRTLLIEDLRDLLDAETQLLEALPKMASASHHPKVAEAFQKHLAQTEGQAERLRQSLQLLGAKAEPTSCRAMQGLIEESEERMEQKEEKDEALSDLCLIAAAQKVEHYEISAYGTARTLALQVGERAVARLLSQTLGEEESADYLLTMIAKPILQQASLSELQKAGVGTGGETKGSRGEPKVRHA
jgi:Mn-containing catalase